MANSRHLKRHSMPTSWPVQRKTITFISKPNPGSHKRDYVTSILVILRDVLGYVQTSKEAKYVVHEQEVLVNGTKITDIKYAVGLFEVIEFPLLKEKYTVLFDNFGKIKLVSAKDDKVFLKVSGKTKAKGAKLQLNYMNGFNTLVDESTFNLAKVQDTVVYNFKKKSIESVEALKEGSFVYIFDGKFKGQIGQVKTLTNHAGVTRDLATLEIEGQEHSTAKDYCYVIGSKKTDVKRFA